MENRRIRTFDSKLKIITKMSDDNISTMAVINELLFEKVVPRKFLEDGLSTVLLMDAVGLYGDQIEILFNQVCGKDLILMRSVLTAVKYGWITSQQLIELCNMPDHFYDDLKLVRDIYHKLSEIGNDPNVSPQYQIRTGIIYSR